MNEKDAVAKLRAEGYGHVFVWEDGPGAVYPDHTHPGQSAHIVVRGEISLTTAKGTVTCGPGDRFDVDAGEVHSARVGPRGCRYVIGE